MESKILSALMHDRDSFERVKDYIKEEDFTPDGGIILSEIKEYYNQDVDACFCDPDIVKSRITRRVNNNKLSNHLIKLVDGLPQVSASNITKEVLSLHAQNIGLALAQEIGKGSTVAQIRPLLDKYNDIVAKEALEDTSQELVSVPISGLVKSTMSPEGLIKIYPKSLNDRLDGGARKGHHVLVYAPTEMGKTLVVVNMTAGFLRQGLKTLYVGNEDPADDILMRIVTRLSGLNKFEVQADVETAERKAKEAGYDNLIFADLAPGTFARISSLIDKYIPDVVILDQLSNIDTKGASNDSRSANLELAAKLARGLAKSKSVLMVSVCQAADSATGKIVLGRGDVHNSNVGIPGQCDLMIGVGANDQMESIGMREFSLVKNKISGNHDHFTVRFNTQLSKVEEA